MRQPENLTEDVLKNRIVLKGQKILNKRLVNDVLLATSDGASNAIVATGLPPSVRLAVPICWPAFSGAASTMADYNRL